MIQVVRVINNEHDPRGHEVLLRARALGVTNLTGVRSTSVYRLEGLSVKKADTFARQVLCDPITQSYTLGLARDSRSCEIGYKPGVMNPAVSSILKAAHDLGFSNLVAADASVEYQFEGDINADDLDRIKQMLVNPVVSQVVTMEPKTLRIGGESGIVALIPIGAMSDDELMILSKDSLFLNLEEMRAIRAEFRRLGRDAKDAEPEVIAQWWSQHCGHKSFLSYLLVDGQKKRPLLIRLREEAERHYKDLVLSAFEDNAGVINFYDGYAICAKGETHNSPSAIEPYGGAMTGSGGVFRDIMGTGQGAKTIMSTDIFCFGPWGLSPDQLPTGCLHPMHLLRQCVAGVRDYGNRIGIPTANGSFHFEYDFRAKPTVLVGAYGIVPEKYCRKGKPRVGDKVIAVGGKTGRDGIHGATFSSGEMTDRTSLVNSSAVQIGNAIEEKRMSDALLACRDAELIEAITDCGAGGFSSAIGEIGSETGVIVWLDRAPLKYSGLAPWEILLSESQERMVAAVDPKNVDQFIEICAAHNVEATIVGEFTSDHKFTVLYNNTAVCDLDMEFLKHGLPRRDAVAIAPKPNDSNALMPERFDLEHLITQVVAHPNVCSREPVVRQYDHQVQGTNALHPYGGVHHDAPNDAVVVTPLLGKPYGVVVSHGLNPRLSHIDPYGSTIWSAIEALANLVAVGGDVEKSALVDNFISAFPDAETMGHLDAAVDALVDIMRAFDIPFISGKDSLSSTFRGKDGTVIKIPLVVCVSAFGKILDVRQTVSADFKQAGSSVILLGRPDRGAMGGSIYAEIAGQDGGRVPSVDLRMVPSLFRALHNTIKTGSVLACHDISEAGLALALAEMCFGGNMGIDIDLGLAAFDNGKGQATFREDLKLFNETPGCFVVEVAAGRFNEFASHFGSLPMEILGGTTAEKTIIINRRETELCRLDVDALKAVWQAPMKEVFPQ